MKGDVGVDMSGSWRKVEWMVGVVDLDDGFEEMEGDDETFSLK